MQNASPPLSERGAATKVVTRVAGRSLQRRQATYEAEVQRLLDVGLEVLTEAGTATEPKVTEIIKRAGVSNQAFYRHFAGKDQFVAAIVEAGLLRLVGYLKHQMAKETAPEEQIRRWIEGVMSQAANASVARATRAVMWNRQKLPAEVATANTSTRHALGELLREPVAAAGSADPARDTDVIFEAVMGRMLAFLWEGNRPRAKDVAHLVAFCLAGIHVGRADGVSR